MPERLETEVVVSGRGRRCARHALAAGPDGLCALCRSESLPPPRSYPAWVLGSFLAIILLVCAGTVTVRALRSLTRAETPRAEATQTGASAADGLPAPADVVAAPEPPPRHHESAPTIEPLPAPVAAAAQTAAADAATQNPREPAPARESAPSEAELRAALRATPVVMYAASWCGVCRKARRFLTENGFAHQEIDADSTPGAWDKIEQLTGRRAVPVIVVDGDVSSGLDAERILNAAARSMEKRLGVSGIQFRAN